MSPEQTPAAALPSVHLLLNAAVAAAAALIVAALSLPSRLLYGLHTYIHPDNLASGDGLRAAIRRPDQTAAAEQPKRRPRSKDSRRNAAADFDESKAQLFRLRLADAHLYTRVFFSDYRVAFVLSTFALSTIALHRFQEPGTSAAVSVLASLLAAGNLLFGLTKASVERSASKRSERQLSVLCGILGFLASLSILFLLCPSFFEFTVGESGLVKVSVSAVAGFIAAVLSIPAARAARSFWLGTDQLRWNLSVVSCGAFGGLLYVVFLLNVFAPQLWVKRNGGFVDYRVWVLTAAAVSQLLALRLNVQTYLNEAVLSWYQRLHSSRAPDLDYGRAKVFLHNHYLCLVVLQFFSPPTLALLLLGVSQLRGNLFNACVEECSALLKEMSLFLAWWVVFAWAVLTMFNLMLYRCGFLFVS